MMNKFVKLILEIPAEGQRGGRIIILNQFKIGKPKRHSLSCPSGGIQIVANNESVPLVQVFGTGRGVCRICAYHS